MVGPRAKYQLKGATAAVVIRLSSRTRDGNARQRRAKRSKRIAPSKKG
jgi:hypothetical protein